MMNIIAASRLRAVVETNVNTIVGGVASEITTAQKFANKTSLSVFDITNFQIVGDDIQMSIQADYSLNVSAFNELNFPVLSQKITCYIDFEGKCTTVNNQAFTFSNIKLFHSPSCRIQAFQNFRDCQNLKVISAESSVPVGESVLSDGVFNQETNCDFISNIINQTNNSGSPDEDITALLNQGGFVKYKDLTNTNQTTAPTAPTISANTIGSTYVELNVSQPTHVNILKYALVFVNGVFNGVFEINNTYAFRLTSQTSYNIKVIIADEYFNISTYSNAINVTTTTIPTLFQNAVAYYKLDETSGDAIDVVNGYNGTLFGGVTQGVAGKIGTAYSFDGVDGYIDLPNLDDKIGTNDFTISCWFKTTQTSVFRLIQNRGNGPLGSKIGFLIRYDGVNNDYNTTGLDIGNGTFVGFEDVVFNENDNNWHLISLRFENSLGKLSLFIDGVNRSTKTNSNLIGKNYNGEISEGFEIGRSSGGNQYYNGDMDEVSVILEALTDTEIIDLYNNGIGTTI